MWNTWSRKYKIRTRFFLALDMFFSPKATKITSSHLLLTLSNYICFHSETHHTMSSLVNSTPYTAWHNIILFSYISSVQCSVVLCCESVNSAEIHFKSHLFMNKRICWRRTHGSASNILHWVYFFYYLLALTVFVKQWPIVMLAWKSL